jgi:hypothetical protein
MSVYGYGNLLGCAYAYPRREIKSSMVAQPRKWAKQPYSIEVLQLEILGLNI